MGNIPEPVFNSEIPAIAWKKIYVREYGVQYSEVAVSLFALDDEHFPETSAAQIVIPEDSGNTGFYIDQTSWNMLVHGLNAKYAEDIEKLREYERQFLRAGEDYLNFSKQLPEFDLQKYTDQKLLSLFYEYQGKQNSYTAFLWSAFILNDYVADNAVQIIETYIQKQNLEIRRQEIISSLFKPQKLAAILSLQQEVESTNRKFSQEKFDDLYERFKWLSCLDIHNKPWTKRQFEHHIQSFDVQSASTQLSFEKVAKELDFSTKDLEYLHIAKRFVYLKDVRDDFRRQSVYYSAGLWKELSRRMELPPGDTSYLQSREIIAFLENKSSVSGELISQRKKGFAVYLDKHKKPVCIQGYDIAIALQKFKLLPNTKQERTLTGRTASGGTASGKVTIVRGVADLSKVRKGDVMVAITTHPDYVPAMRRAAAIVTDEGGITSHAAIVSREYGIPCIVGTKEATKLLKDGDMVEVDADAGFVVIKK